MLTLLTAKAVAQQIEGALTQFKDDAFVRSLTYADERVELEVVMGDTIITYESVGGLFNEISRVTSASVIQPMVILDIDMCYEGGGYWVDRQYVEDPKLQNLLICRSGLENLLGIHLTGKDIHITATMGGDVSWEWDEGREDFVVKRGDVVFAVYYEMEQHLHSFGDSFTMDIKVWEWQ